MIDFATVLPLITDKPFTAEQMRAITESGNIIVSAGAGSGKTKVMIARIIYKLMQGETLEQMLIVTFTRAAAADMRIQLSDKLAAIKRNSAQKEARDIAAAALDRLCVASIGTLHSYCQKLIKRYFFAAGIDPACEICDEGEAGILKTEAVVSALEEALESGDVHIKTMYDYMTTRKSDDGMVKAISAVLDFALSTAEPEKYLSYSASDEKYYPELEALLSAKQSDISARAQALKAEIEASGFEPLFKAACGLCDFIAEKIDRAPDTPRHKPATQSQQQLKADYGALRAAANRHAEFKKECRAALGIDGERYAAALKAVALSALDKYARKKAARFKTDYSDLEHGAYGVLCDAECSKEISREIKYVFIDEFQDVNPLQNDIAQAFARFGAEIFVVGDIKQSIYGFRRCSPDHFAAAIERAEKGDGKHIALTKNFRSTAPVIDFINGVFSKIMTRDFGGVDYASPEQMLVCGNGSTCGRAEFVRIPVASTQSKQVPIPYSVRMAAGGVPAHDPEAVFIAESIIDWLDNERKAAKSERDLPKLGDVAVLVRSTSDAFFSALAAELDSRGVSYCFGRKSSVKSYPEAVALMDIARCCVNRYDDVAMYTALRSPMGGFSDAELYKISRAGEATAVKRGVQPIARRKRLALYQKLAAYVGEYKARIDKFITLAEYFSEFAKKRDAADLLGEITSRIDYFQYVYELGGQARAVETLIDCAENRRCGIHEFIEYYDGADFELDVACGTDAVNITTEHSAKGLEYKLVIVADTAHKFNFSDYRQKIIVSERGVFVKIPSGNSAVKTAPYLIEQTLAPNRQCAEELRLFYVGLTRAKNTLIVCGKTDVKGSDSAEYNRPLDFLRGIPARCAPEFASGEEENAEMSALPQARDGIVRAVKDRILKSKSYRASELPIKTCVTAVAAVSATDEENDYTAAAPVMIEDDDRVAFDGSGFSADAMLRGTAYHKAMELIDFAAPDLDAVKARCENFALVDENKILAAARAMRELTADAEHVAKERAFIVGLDASECGYNERGRVLVQGVIDLLVLFADNTAIIVDYKTGDPERRMDEYKIQLGLYARAVEKSAPYKVKATYIYAFDSGKLILAERR